MMIDYDKLPHFDRIMHEAEYRKTIKVGDTIAVAMLGWETTLRHETVTKLTPTGQIVCGERRYKDGRRIGGASATPSEIVSPARAKSIQTVVDARVLSRQLLKELMSLPRPHQEITRPQFDAAMAAITELKQALRGEP
jgi:hypothetical protein